MRRSTKPCNSSVLFHAGSCSPPQISGKYPLGGTSTGAQRSAAKNPSTSSRFIARSFWKRRSIASRRLYSASEREDDNMTRTATEIRKQVRLQSNGTQEKRQRCWS